jgi:ABC-2 type transport system permease protein
MHTLRILIAAKFRILRSMIFDTRRSMLLRNLAAVFVLTALTVGAYRFFRSFVFRYLVELDDIGYLLIDRLVSVGFLAFFFMLVISSFVAALATLFRSAETEYLFSTPLPDLSLFTVKYLDVVVISSWAILLMSMPILYSYAKVREFGALEYGLTGVAVVIPFIIFATAIGTLLALIAMFAAKRVSIRSMVLVGAAVFSGLVYTVIYFASPNQLVVPFTEDFRSLNLFLNSFEINSHPFTPNFWLIQSLRSLVLKDYGRFILYCGSLMSTALFALGVLYAAADRLFFPIWRSSSEQSLLLRLGGSKSSTKEPNRPGRPTDSPFRALLLKDILIFVRDPGQWSQLFLLMALLALYFVNLYFIPKDIEIEQWRTIISLMNFGFCGFIMATLAVRFVYPSISLEGDSIWVLGSSPLSTRTLFREKFWSSFTVFLLLTECIALISGIFLRLEFLYQTLTVVGILMMSVSLSSIAVGFGAAFPDFGERNPSRIASSPGGILTIVTTLAYIAAMVVLVGFPAYRYTEYLVLGGQFPSSTIWICAVIAILLNSVAIVAPLRFGARSLAQREF